MEVTLPCGTFCLVVDPSMWRYTVYAVSSVEKLGCMASLFKQVCWRFSKANGMLYQNGKATVELMVSYDCHSPYSNLGLTVTLEDEPLMRYDYFLIFLGNQPTYSSENVYGIGKDGVYRQRNNQVTGKTMTDLQDFNRRLALTIKLSIGTEPKFFL
jgi:hypothetical protein